MACEFDIQGHGRLPIYVPEEEVELKKTKKNRRLRAFRQSHNRLSPGAAEVPEVI
jgi:hypothetical protein